MKSERKAPTPEREERSGAKGRNRLVHMNIKELFKGLVAK